MGTASGIIVLIIDPISGFSPLSRMEPERFAVGQYRPYGTGQLPHRCCGRLPIGHPFPFCIEELRYIAFRTSGRKVQDHIRKVLPHKWVALLGYDLDLLGIRGR